MVGQKLLESSRRNQYKSMNFVVSFLEAQIPAHMKPLDNLTENAVLLELSTIKKSGFRVNGTKSVGCKQFVKVLVSTTSVLSKVFRELVTIPPL
jgi:hypothetical protein